jgi:DNA-binding transcriptional LysR family regulator
MDLRWLEDALILIEERNLSRAAARRNVTQPAFSRRIRAFEDWVGIELLERRANGIDIHPSLIDNASEIRSVIEHLASLRKRMAHQQPRTEELEISVQHALAASVFPLFHREVSGTRPQLVWRMHALDRDECVASFLRGDSDVLFCYEAPGLPSLPFDKSIFRKVWRSDSLVPVVGGSLRYAIKRDLSIERPVPLVTYIAGSHFGKLVQSSGLRPQDGRTVVESSFSVGVAQLVRAGAGVGWLPLTMIRSELASGALVSLGPRHGTIELEIALFAAKSNPQAVEVISAL